MLANQSSSYLGRSPASTSILGILFFLLGAPHIYGALKRRAQRRKPFTPPRYVMVAALASAIAGVVELSLL
ncbi:hypothetical protein [Nodosilinea sp. P-1105]|uniref:hypothetical protein n=1 Tax=Nodosilinea sp. P-1105 TaxID=2546229 RepID=UPI00146E3075|nr:hypothetical protein [Nodosilinea sp. P-1105]NMF84073.1 hypothetical protein [Nodosilinea sp. P-1105]